MFEMAEAGRQFQQLAPGVGGSFANNHALRWFDGFWDFLVPNREALERQPSCQLEGVYEKLPWLLLCWRGLAADDEIHLDLFVEVADPPNPTAPWPRTDPIPRPRDAELAMALDDAGFHVEVGRWGVRATARHPERLLRAGLSALESSFTTVLRFAQSIARAERYLDGYDSSSA